MTDIVIINGSSFWVINDFIGKRFQHIEQTVMNAVHEWYTVLWNNLISSSLTKYVFIWFSDMKQSNL